MLLQGSSTDNPDKSKNFSIGAVNAAETASGSVFVNNYKENQGGTRYGAAGGSLALHSPQGHSASVTAQHIPAFGNQVTAAATTNLTRGDHHSVDMSLSHTRNRPKVGPGYSTHSAGIDAQIGRVGASAAVSHTPMFKMTEHSVGGRVNLHQSDTGSAHIGVGASKVTTPHHRGNWQPGVFFGVKKQF